MEAHKRIGELLRESVVEDCSVDISYHNTSWKESPLTPTETKCVIPFPGTAQFLDSLLESVEEGMVDDMIARGETGKLYLDFDFKRWLREAYVPAIERRIIQAGMPGVKLRLLEVWTPTTFGAYDTMLFGALDKEDAHRIDPNDEGLNYALEELLDIDDWYEDFFAELLDSYPLEEFCYEDTEEGWH